MKISSFYKAFKPEFHVDQISSCYEVEDISTDFWLDLFSDHYVKSEKVPSVDSWLRYHRASEEQNTLKRKFQESRPLIHGQNNISAGDNGHIRACISFPPPAIDPRLLQNKPDTSARVHPVDKHFSLFSNSPIFSPSPSISAHTSPIDGERPRSLFRYTNTAVFHAHTPTPNASSPTKIQTARLSQQQAHISTSRNSPQRNGISSPVPMAGRPTKPLPRTTVRREAAQYPPSQNALYPSGGSPLSNSRTSPYAQGPFTYEHLASSSISSSSPSSTLSSPAQTQPTSGVSQYGGTPHYVHPQNHGTPSTPVSPTPEQMQKYWAYRRFILENSSGRVPIDSHPLKQQRTS